MEGEGDFWGEQFCNFGVQNFWPPPGEVVVAVFLAPFGVLALAVPFYRAPGHVDPLVLGVPVWAMPGRLNVPLPRRLRPSCCGRRKGGSPQAPHPPVQTRATNL